MKYLVYIFTFVFLTVPSLYAQSDSADSVEIFGTDSAVSLPDTLAEAESRAVRPDALVAADSLQAETDTVISETDTSYLFNMGLTSDVTKMKRFERKTYERSLHYGEHSPHKATLYAMVCPGLGQIYNKQYWKLPILYGGIAAAIYGVCWNNKTYEKYGNAYLELSGYIDSLAHNPDFPYPDHPAWEKIPLRGAEWEQLFKERPSSMIRYKEIMKKKRSSYKRNRDLCYITLAGIYALNIIDACVFAHFYDFYISDDLSFHWRPGALFNRRTGKASYGASVAFEF